MLCISVTVSCPGSLHSSTSIPVGLARVIAPPPPISEVKRTGENVRKLLFDLHAHQLQVINPPALELRQDLKSMWTSPIRKYKPNSDYLLFRFILWVMQLKKQPSTEGCIIFNLSTFSNCQHQIEYLIAIIQGFLY